MISFLVWIIIIKFDLFIIIFAKSLWFLFHLFFDESKIILYAPTWRQYAKVELFPFADYDIQNLQSFLAENKIKIYIRFHPAYEEDIPKDLFTPLFAISRIAGWGAHILEEIVTNKRIMRPAYKSVSKKQAYERPNK